MVTVKIITFSTREPIVRNDNGYEANVDQRRRNNVIPIAKVDRKKVAYNAIRFSKSSTTYCEAGSYLLVVVSGRV